jgi:hypothetical protein
MINANLSINYFKIVLGFLLIHTALWAAPSVSSKTPATHAQNISTSSNIVVTFDENILGTSITSSSFNVDGSQTGLIAGVCTGGGTATITFNPSDDFVAGEHISVTLTPDISNTSSETMVNPVTWQFTVASGSSPTSFTYEAISTTAAGAYCVISADVDGDGDIDVLSASASDDKIAWYENDGSESFTAHSISTTADGATSVSTSDIDGDGDMDILSASHLDHKIAWYENNGSESFTEHSISTSANGARSVTSADVDGDGDMDVLSASLDDDKIAWYENDGSESFTEHSISTAADGAHSVSTADVDGDGDLDVLSASYVDNKITWYENNGSESFTAHSISSSANGAICVTTADVDGDGDLDVLSATHLGAKIAWYENNGSESFTEHSISTIAEGARSVTTADMDGDGDMDVLSASESDSKIAWYENNGSESFTEHSISTAANSALSVTTADVDGDGELDVLSASSGDNKIALYLSELFIANKNPAANAPNIPTSSNIVVTFSESILGSSVTTSSFNIDGSQTGLIAGVYSGGGTSEITFNPTIDFVAGEVINVTITTDIAKTAGGTLANPYTWKFTVASESSATNFSNESVSITANFASSVTTADVDGDGDMDVLSASASDDKIAWYENNGSESFIEHSISTSADGAQSVTSADVDGDGDIDVLSASSLNDIVAWFENDGSGNFATHIISYSADGAYSVTTADIDGDGDIDVLSASASDDKIAWYENNGSESFTEHSISTSADGTRSVTSADVDGDGDLDVLSASGSDDKIAWYENNGSEGFTEHSISTSADGAVSVTTADVDGDGDIDVLSASFDDDKIAWYENNGSESFTEHSISTSADGAFSVSTVDVDGDGDMDVLSASYSDNKIAWYENNGSESFTEHSISTSANGARSVTTADVDGDGDMDVLSASANDDKIALFRSALFVTQKNPDTHTLNVSTSSNIVVTCSENILESSITTSSFNIDGSQTGLIAGSYTGGGTSAITFDPTADFVAGEVISVTITTDISSTSGDALVHPVTWEFTIASESSATYFTNETISDNASGARSVTTADVDGDGDMDVLSASYSDNKIAWYENDGSESFTEHSISTATVGAMSVTTADMDGDGDMDVLSASSVDDRVAWYENNGLESFELRSISTDANNAQSVTTADVDGDGDMDVLSASYSDNKIAWYENDGSESFTEHSISTSAHGAQSVTTADVDGDGDMDVLSASFGNDKIAWYENDGSESFTEHSISTTADGAYCVTTADVDGDGDLDVLSASRSDYKIAWYENDGSESFAPHSISTLAYGVQSVATADVDGDGDVDVLSASAADKIVWWENDGSESFSGHMISSTADGAYCVATADVDGDGDIDVLSASSSDNKIAWYENVYLPTLSTNSISNIVFGGATSGGTVSDDDGVAVTARGVCWSMSENPTISDSHSSDGTGIGSFTSQITRLLSGQTYYVRSYATNAAGTSYGDNKSFITTDIPGNALDFDGSDDYVNCGNDVSLQISGTAITIEAWIYVIAFAENTYENTIIDKTGGSYAGYTFQCGGSGVLTFTLGDGTTWRQVISADNALNTGQWHHIAGVFDGSTQRLYVDGKSVASTILGYSILAETATNLYLGSAAHYAGRSFSGKMDEVRIWNTARNNVEIPANMHTVLAGDESGLVAYYQFDHSSGTSLSDLAGSNTGTLTNMADEDWETSSVPAGASGACVDNTSQTTIGDAGKQLKTTITSGGDETNYLGIYCNGSGTGLIESGETFPSGVTQRSDIFWGVEEYGSVTADLVIDYSDVEGIGVPAAMKLLKRTDALEAWTDVTSSFTHDLDNRTFSGTDLTSFSEFSIGDGGDNSLPVVLSAFYAETNERSAGIKLYWTTDSEVENLGFILERASTTSTADLDPDAIGGDETTHRWIKIASYESDEALAGQGSVTEQTIYFYDDLSAVLGESYDYRLGDVSYDGEIVYHTQMLSKVLAVRPPDEFNLYRAYPNPFNPTTTIQYDVPESSQLSLIIYDIQGREVLRLTNEMKQTGFHQAIWHGLDATGKQVESGMYLVRMTSTEYSKTQRILLLR